MSLAGNRTHSNGVNIGPRPPAAVRADLEQVSQGLSGQSQDVLNVYWQNQVTKLETDDHDFKLHQLPLARIKKVMKADPEVKMISAEAPILFAKGCDIFITELTMRAWIHAEENKRRTLQRSDIASALTKSDMFDFLIDIVPREEANTSRRSGAANAQPAAPAGMPQSSVQQTGVHPPPQQMQPDYAVDPHIAQQGMYAPQMGQVQQVQQADAGAAAYGQHPQFGTEQLIYNQYLPQQVISLARFQCFSRLLTPYLQPTGLGTDSSKTNAFVSSANADAPTGSSGRAGPGRCGRLN
jgi:nuclear transcription factor Y gamma